MFGIAAILVLGGIAWVTLRPAGDAGGASLATADRPATLSPARFTSDPKARAAYQVAKDIPEVLEQLPCFCGCMIHFGHKNNLFCFTDEHGSACDICENIALDARDLHDKGWTVDRIKQTIIDRYSRFAP